MLLGGNEWQCVGDGQVGRRDAPPWLNASPRDDLAQLHQADGELTGARPRFDYYENYYTLTNSMHAFSFFFTLLGHVSCLLWHRL